MKRRWWIAWLLFLSTLLNYFDRQIFALVSPVVRKEFAMSATQYSQVLTAFLIGYTITQLLAGILVDRIGTKRGMILAMAWWSLAGAGVAFARSRLQLAALLLLMGMGEAANWPTAVKAIREWFEPERRGMAIGLFNAGSSTGAIVAPLIVTSLTLQFSWRAPFAICGVLGILWIVVWRNVYRVPPTPTAPPLAVRLPMFAFMRDRRSWAILLARFFADPIWMFYVFWLPDYLAHSQSLSLRDIGETAWIPFAAATLGNFAGGAGSGWMIRYVGVVRARLVIMCCSAIIMACGITVRYCHRPMPAIAVISVVVFAYSCWAANVLTLPSDLFPSHLVGSVTGAAGSLAGVGGMCVTLLTGYLVDHFSYAPVFVLLACLPLLAFGCTIALLAPEVRSPLSSKQNVCST